MEHLQAQLKTLNSSRRDGVLFQRPPRERAFAEIIDGDLRDLAGVIASIYRALELPRQFPLEEQVFIDNRSGISFIEPFVPATVHILQDCNDPEAHLRQSVHWQKLGALSGNPTVHKIPEFRPAAIGGAISHFLGELAYKGDVVILDGQKAAYTENPTIFIANAAPRTGDPAQQGAPFVFAQIGVNIFYFGTNTEELSFLKPFIIGWPRGLSTDDCQNSTFRSRFLGDRVAEWRAGDISRFQETPIDISAIPNVPVGTIRAVDNFGNVKPNWTVGDLSELDIKFGDTVHISYAERTVSARFVEKLEDGCNGELIIAPGSSLADLAYAKDYQLVDIFHKGNHGGRGAADVLCDEFVIPHHAGARELYPLPGLVLSISKT